MPDLLGGIYPDTPLDDAFARVRVATPQSLFEVNQLDGGQVRVLGILKKGFTLFLILVLLTFYATVAVLFALGSVVVDFLRRRH